MTEQFPILIIIAPLFGAILIALLGFRHQSLCLPTVLGSLAISCAAAVGTFLKVLEQGTVLYNLSGWERVTTPRGLFSVSIEYRVDAISGLVLVAIAAVGLLNAIYSKVHVVTETPNKVPHYYILYLLLVAGLAGMTITNDAFNLYVLIEISSLSSYALIAIGSRRAVLASFNYLIMGTIGASFYLLGVGYLYIKTGTLNMTDIHAALVTLPKDSPSIQVALILILIGLWIKMAFFPLHGWLPNAYAYSPTATSTLMGPLVTKVMIYVMIRMMLSLFGAEYVFDHLQWTNIIVGLSVIAIVAGSLFALSRSDLRKMLTYLIVAEVGYMVGGAWLANSIGMTGAIYHILSDAMMTFTLFMVVGIIITRTGKTELTAFQGLFRKMPITMTGFTIAALSMIGLPPTCGFFSKYYLVRGGIEAGQWAYVGALLFSSLINAVIFFRLIEMAYFHGGKAYGEEITDKDHEHHRSRGKDLDAEPDETLEEVPWSMLAPMLMAAASLLAIGIFNRPIAGWINAALETLNLAQGG